MVKWLIDFRTRAILVVLLFADAIWIVIRGDWYWFWPAWLSMVLLATLIVEIKPVKRLLRLEERP